MIVLVFLKPMSSIYASSTQLFYESYFLPDDKFNTSMLYRESPQPWETGTSSFSYAPLVLVGGSLTLAGMLAWYLYNPVDIPTPSLNTVAEARELREFWYNLGFYVAQPSTYGDVLSHFEADPDISRQSGATCLFYACYESVKRAYGSKLFGNARTFVRHFDHLIPGTRNLRNIVSTIKTKRLPISVEIINLRIARPVLAWLPGLKINPAQVIDKARGDNPALIMTMVASAQIAHAFTFLGIENDRVLLVDTQSQSYCQMTVTDFNLCVLSSFAVFR